MIELTEVTKRFSGVTALDRVSCDVEQGEIFALLGPNGAGKTTLLRIILGLLEPDEGSIAFAAGAAGAAGAAANGAGRPAGREIGYLPEERGLYPDMPAHATLAFFGTLRGMSRAHAAREADRWLERLDLVARRNDKVKTLSKGNQQKLQLAAAIIHTPRLAILDEPFSGFDPINQELCLELIRELSAKNVTIVLSAHQMQLVERIAQRIVVLARGRAVAAGTLDDIRAQWQAERRMTLEAAAEPAPGALDGVPGVVAWSAVGRRINATLRRDALLGDVLAGVGERVQIVDVHTERDTLHDLYLRAVGADAAEARP